MQLNATNSTANVFQSFVFQAAVPKVCNRAHPYADIISQAQTATQTFQISLQPASSNIVPAFNMGGVTQNFTIINNERVCSVRHIY